MAVEQLEGLSRSLQEIISDDAAERVVSAACLLVGITARLFASVDVPELDLHRVLLSVQVILRWGGAAQPYFAGQALNGQLSIGQLCSRLGMQVWALAAWQHLVSRLPDSTNPVDWVKAVAPPALLQQWLHCVVLNMEMSAPASWKPGGMYVCQAPACTWAYDLLGHGLWSHRNAALQLSQLTIWHPAWPRCRL